MEQFVFFPASLYNKNKSLKTQAATKQELSNFQADQNLTHQTDSLKREINKELFSKSDSLVDKTLSCPRIKLSNSKLYPGWCRSWKFLLDFPQQLRRKTQTLQTFFLLYLTPLVYLRLWFWIRMLYTQGGVADESVGNLVKTSNLSVSKMRQILHSKLSYTKFTHVTRQFRRMKAFARFKKRVWFWTWGTLIN